MGQAFATELAGIGLFNTKIAKNTRTHLRDGRYYKTRSIRQHTINYDSGARRR